jgi:RNA ligase (TIGR02306 family)
MFFMENLNSVCYVGSINEIKSIDGADNIELVVVNGWNAITKKGEYQIGDLVVIATTDSVIPQELSDSMGVTGYLRKGQRVRTVKLRGVYSECLIMNKNVIPQLRNFPTLTEGEDLMELLGVFKYEPPVTQIQLSSGKKIKYKANPNFHVYYKFPNLKNTPNLFNEDDDVSITRKLHGTNARYGIVKKSRLTIWDRVKRLFGNKWVEFEYVYGSHNVEKGSDSNGFYSTDVWRTIGEKYNIEQKLWDFVKNDKNNSLVKKTGIVIYGEIYGPGIQKNYDYGLDELKLACFDVTFDGKYQGFFMEKSVFEVLELPQVELLYFGKWSKEEQDKYVFNNYIDNTKVPHEGVVVKSINGDRHKTAKIINPEYLIYGEKNNVGDSH